MDTTLISSNDAKFISFGYCDYTNDHKPYYVGIGCLTRILRKHRNRKHVAISRDHGQNRKIVVAFTGDKAIVWQKLCAWETETIQTMKTLHEPGLLGCNFTLGGDGVVGFKRIKSEEERLKISQSKLSLYSNPIERKKLGDAIRLAKSDPVKYRHHCDAQKLRYSDPEERRKAHEFNTQKRRVRQLTPDGKFIAEYPSASVAIQTTGISNLKSVCRGVRKLAGGFIWEYVSAS